MSVEEEEHITETEPAIDDVANALRTVLTAEPAILLDALTFAFRIAKDALQIPKDRYHIVIVPDVGEGTVETFSSLEELLALMRTARQRGGQAFAFRGDSLLPSKGGHYLVTPWGRFPLFAEDHDTEIDPRGYLGPQPVIPQPAPAPVTEAPGNGSVPYGEDAVDEDIDEDVDEDEDEVEDDD